MNGMRFLADEMLGKMARWLRALGVDVLYQVQFDDDKILGVAKREARLVLTRDHRLLKRLQSRRIPSLFIRNDKYEEQIREFFSSFPKLKNLNGVLSRCMECNEVLESLSKEKVKDRVWPYVFETQENFSYCRRCDRVYWRATHVEKIIDRLKALVEES